MKKNFRIADTGKHGARRLAAAALLLSMTMWTLTGCGGSQETEPEEVVKTESVYADVVTAYQEAIDMEWAYNVAYELAYNEEMAGCCGFRTAGSDYEHACADYLEGLMTEIGLEDVEQVGVDVDRWQFDDASLTIANTKIDITPASYAQSGTDEGGITAEIVNVGNGFAMDYEGKDVEGKIVLAGVDQANESWIDGYIHEAYLRGAAALVTYDKGGYAEGSDEIRNMQDVCADDYLPTVSISAKEAQRIRKAIKKGNNECTLRVDCEVEGWGTSYNVVGTIKGKSSEQQIVVSAHYDKYFYGFQDDSVAVANVLAIAKAMKESGYVPENDIVFVCHGAEEWGASGTQYDWTTGAWEMINNARPEWQGKTLAMINFELSGYRTGQDAATIASVPELYSMVQDFAGSELTDITDTGAYKGGVSTENEAVTTMEDGVSYRFAGVPYFLNGGSLDSAFMTEKYHTEVDDESTYSKKVHKLNIGLYGALAIVMDQSPALELNMTEMASWLEESYSDEWAEEAGADTETFKEELQAYKENTKAMYDEAVRINEAYETAYAEGDEEQKAALRAEGAALNAKALEAFGIAQDEFLCVVSSWDIFTRHEGAVQTLDLLRQIIDAAEEDQIWAKDEASGAADLAWQLNGYTQYGYYVFDPEGVEMTEETYFTDYSNYWGTDKTVPFVDTGDATRALIFEKDTETAISIYEDALHNFLPYLAEYIEWEIEGMQEINELLTQ